MAEVLPNTSCFTMEASFNMLKAGKNSKECYVQADYRSLGYSLAKSFSRVYFAIKKFKN